jgi:hypothetical protein
VSSPYIDDFILIGDDYDECADNVLVNTAVRLLDNLGFVPHPKKTVFIPTQILVFLGFLLNSITMTVSLTPDKAKKLKAAVNHLFLRQRPCIHEVAQVVGQSLYLVFLGSCMGPYFSASLSMKNLKPSN